MKKQKDLIHQEYWNHLLIQPGLKCKILIFMKPGAAETNGPLGSLLSGKAPWLQSSCWCELVCRKAYLQQAIPSFCNFLSSLYKSSQWEPTNMMVLAVDGHQVETRWSPSCRGGRISRCGGRHCFPLVRSFKKEAGVLAITTQLYLAPDRWRARHVSIPGPRDKQLKTYPSPASTGAWTITNLMLRSIYAAVASLINRKLPVYMR